MEWRHKIGKILGLLLLLNTGIVFIVFFVIYTGVKSEEKLVLMCLIQQVDVTTSEDTLKLLAKTFLHTFKFFCVM